MSILKFNIRFKFRFERIPFTAFLNYLKLDNIIEVTFKVCFIHLYFDIIIMSKA